MKLKVMNCKNCNAPLQLVDEKLVCEFCGGTFDIEKDESDLEYEKIVNAEEYIRRSLEDKTAQLEEYYRQQEQKKIEEERRAEEKRKQFQKEMRRKARMRSLRSIILCIIMIAGCFFLVKYLKDKYKKMEPAQETSTQVKVMKSYRVTKSDIADDPDFLEDVDKLVFEYVKEEHEDTYISDSDTTWNVVSDPVVLERYLITSGTGSGIYTFLQINLEDENGNVVVGDECVVVTECMVDDKGVVSLEKNSRVEKVETENCDSSWNLCFDYEVMKNEIFDSKYNDMINNGDLAYIIYAL